MTSQIYSQTNSTNCTVPCHTLRNAVKIKYDLNFANQKIDNLRDSVSVLEKISYQKDSIILNKNTEIINLNKKIEYKDSINKETTIRANFYKSEYDKQVTNKWITIIVGSITTICSLIFF